MFELLGGIIAGAAVGGGLVYYISRICRHPALRRHHGTLFLVVLIWLSMVGFKLLIVDAVHPPVDAALHDEMARDIAYEIQNGRYDSVMSEISLGNSAFRLALGVFYAFTSAPKSVVYFAFAGLAAWGSLSLLSLFCKVAQPDHVPTWLILVVCVPPSALFWTTGILKEGPVFWGIAMMLHLTCYLNNDRSRGTLILSLLGIVVVGVLRPHIAAAWLGGIWAGGAVLRGRIVVGAAGIAVVFGLLLLVGQVKPHLMERFINVGVVDTMNSRFANLDGTGGSAIRYSRGAPIPVLDGFLLLFLRPYPTEVSGIEGVLAGLEIWCLSLLILVSWWRLPDAKLILKSPFMVTMLVSLILLAFFFSYSYNMGHMVRQRLQVFPAILALAAIPIFSYSRLVRLRRSTGLRPARHRSSRGAKANLDEASS